VRGGRALLRLQLHGEDAARRGAVLERIRAAIGRAAEGRSDSTTELVSSASSAALARAAHGAGDYRQAAVTRDQLWAVVEGPAVDAAARCTAGEALAGSGDEEERARLRVAADHCADPQVRVALHAIADGGEAEEPVVPSVSRRAADPSTDRR
jgi:hypothetical protein